jgi:hypothetical protein
MPHKTLSGKKSKKGSYKRDFGKGVCICGTEFKKKTTWQANCSQECKNNAWIIRRAEKLKAESKS